MLLVTSSQVMNDSGRDTVLRAGHQRCCGVCGSDRFGTEPTIAEEHRVQLKPVAIRRPSECLSLEVAPGLLRNSPRVGWLLPVVGETAPGIGTIQCSASAANHRSWLTRAMRSRFAQGRDPPSQGCLVADSGPLVEQFHAAGPTIEGTLKRSVVVTDGAVHDAVTNAAIMMARAATDFVSRLDRGLWVLVVGLVFI